MTIKSWEPKNQQISPPTDAINLSLWIEYGHEESVYENAKNLSADEILEVKTVVNQSGDFWLDATKNLSENDVLQLIRFFTLAEENQTEISCGNDSPVIALNKILRKRSQPLSKEMLLWIRQNSSNRFLPNGSIF